MLNKFFLVILRVSLPSDSPRFWNNSWHTTEVWNHWDCLVFGTDCLIMTIIARHLSISMCWWIDFYCNVDMPTSQNNEQAVNYIYNLLYPFVYYVYFNHFLIDFSNFILKNFITACKIPIRWISWKILRAS